MKLVTSCAMRFAGTLRSALPALLLAAAYSGVAAAPPPVGTLRGEVLETRNVDGYIYLRLKTTGSET
jgi:hypothetical protein